MLLPALVLLQTPPDTFDPGPNPLLMQSPTVNRTHIAFEFAGDLWQVPRAGGSATRLTSAPGRESRPQYSPDGKWIAFSGQYDGNTDAFVIPANGGVPKRLTAHPSEDAVLGWTNDGKSVLISSPMLSPTDYPRMFTVPATGGVPKALPFPAGVAAAISPDGSRIAYVPYPKWQQAWKRYRGGQASKIWIGEMSDSKVKEIPRKDNEDSNPMWVGDSIYFISDRNGPFGLFRYDTKSGKVTEEVKGSGFDLKSADAGPDMIVYEKLGSIHLFDPATHQSTLVKIEIKSDFPELRTRIKDVKGAIQDASLSPSGQRIAVDARGWIFTIPAAKGDARLTDETQGVHRRDPAWSPDGKTIAFITDADGDQQMAMLDSATNKEKRIDLGEKPGHYEGPVWSPDSKSIAYTDNKLNLWVLDVASGKSAEIDTRIYAAGGMRPRWSPDSKWLTWSRNLRTHMTAVFLHSFETGKNAQITDGLSDAKAPVFDRDGKHLYFLASTNVGMGIDFEDMSGMAAQPATSSIYAVVLSKDGPNPLNPESDEETGAKKEEKKPEAGPAPTKVDLEGIESRIIVLPAPNQAYQTLEAGPAGTFFTASGGRGTPPSILQFTWKDRKLSPFATGGNFQLNADGTKMLLRSGPGMRIVPTATPPAPGSGEVPLTALSVKIDPAIEWRKMYEEVWRGEKLFFFDPNLNGADAAVLQKRYEPFLKNISSRSDLNYLFTDMLGELEIGHMWARGGDLPGATSVPGGLLGADYSFENGRYRLTRIYDGERWNPGLYAPLSQPGINAKVGEYILAIDGVELTEVNDIYEALEAKAGKQIKLRLGPNPNSTGSREVTVLPVANEANLRFRAWIEDNRRYVDKMTGGRAGYVHIPDTGGGGWEAFQRYYYSQTDKDGMIIDGRFNHGGLINDFMPNEMTRLLDFGTRTRYGEDQRLPITGDFWPEGDADERDVRLRRRHLPVSLQATKSREANRHENVGRAPRCGEFPAHRRRFDQRTG